MDETMENINDTTEATIDDFYSETEDSQILGKVVAGVVTVAVGTAAGFAIKNKDKIKAKIAEKKEARRVKKVNKLMAKLNELAPEKTENEKTEEN